MRRNASQFLLLFLFTLSFQLNVSSQDFPKGHTPKFYTDQVLDELKKADSLWVNKQVEESVEVYQEILKNCEQSHNEKCKQAAAKSNLKLAFLYLEQDIFEDALYYANQSISFASRQSNQCLAAESYLARSEVRIRMIENFLQIGNFEDAYKNEKSLIGLAEKDVKKAKELSDSAIDKHREHLILPINILLNYGKVKKHQGLYREAEMWMMKAKQILTESIEIQSDKYFVDLELAKIYCEMNRPDDAIHLCEGFYNRGDTTDVAQFLMINQILADANDKAQNFQRSSHFYKKAMLLDNQLNDRNTKESLHHIAIRKKLAQTNKKYKQVVSEQDSSVESLDLLQNTLTVVIIAFLLLFIIFLSFFSKQKANAQKFKYQLLKNQQDAEISAVNALLDGREDEREKIGRFLHDQVAALLNSANIHLEVLGTELDQEYLMLTKAQDMIDEVSDQVRNLSHDLLSDLLVKFGLAIALDDLCNRLTTPKIKFSFISPKGEEKKRYELSLENKLYSIAQELSNNIIKHSQANTAFISLNEINGRLVLRVKDNGIGFPESKRKELSGTGLHQIRIRLRSLGGEMKISRDDGFTVVSLYVPLKIAERN